MNHAEWQIPGTDGHTILGVTDASHPAPRASVVILHGHKAFYNYGCYPVLARRLARDLPVAVHRYNASHSGVTRDDSTFARPDLFARDTWNKQVHDLRAVTRAARDGRLPAAPARAPVIVIGHSRGGTACLLSAARHGAHEDKPDALVSMSAPSWCASNIPGKQDEIVRTGRIAAPSARTGQDLYMDPLWLHEQLADPDAHNLLALSANINVRALIVHGDRDETIPVRCARELADVIPNGELAVIAGGDHVFNTVHPADPNADPSPELQETIERVVEFTRRALD